jgi:hypothetical protein
MYNCSATVQTDREEAEKVFENIVAVNFPK